MDEAALIDSARRGDLDAYNRLVLAYQDMVYNQAYRLMGSLEPAEDATQDAFISAYRNLSSYRGGSFKAWLLRIVTNACYDELRRQKRRPTIPLEPLDAEDEEVEVTALAGRPFRNRLRRPPNAPNSTRRYSTALSDLPEDFRAVVILVDVQGLDYSEASQAIGKPLGTVKSRLARARLRLRDCLQGVWELLPAAFRLVEEQNL